MDSIYTPRFCRSHVARTFPEAMPIYAYRCEHCGFQQDVLRKMSDPLLVTCPSCGEATFKKQVTAAGFQLKGSGWYVTDFRNPATKESAKAKTEDAADAPKADGAPSDPKPAADGPAPAPAAAPPAAAPPKPDASPSKASPSGAGSG